MNEQKKTARPRGTDCAKVIQVIVTESLVGNGVPGDPVRTVRQYWNFDGMLLAESDPFSDSTTPTKMPRGMFTHSSFTEARIQNCEFYSNSMEYCCLEGTSFDETDTDHIRMNRCSYDESEWIAERDGITQTM